MKETVFPPADNWEAALMTLPDSSYFELMRSVFGNIRTPFNKQRLMDELATFLSRRETQESIAAYIDRRDHLIIAAIAALGHPAPGDLESFFAGEFSYAEIHALLLNLEERLIVYRFQDGKVRRLALNPLLEPVLAPFAADKSPLFPTVPAPSARGSASPKGGASPKAEGSPKEPSPKQPALNGGIIAALVSFILDRPVLFKSEGKLRKKILDEGKLMFPGMNMEVLISALILLGLFKMEGNRFIPDSEKLSAFASCGDGERLEYLAAGIYLYYRSQGSLEYVHRGKIQAAARLIHRFLGMLGEDRLYPLPTLFRVFGILLHSGGESSGQGSADALPVLLKSLEQAGLLESRGQSRWQLRKSSGPAEENPRRISLDAAFSVLMYPETDFPDALGVAEFASVRETGTLIRFEITRGSAVRGFDRGISAEAMLGLIKRLSGEEPDRNLSWSLQDWENRYHEVSLCRGIVLSLSPDRRYLAEAEPLSSLISRTLAPGVYLLSVSDEMEASEALERAGVDIIAMPEMSGPSRSAGGQGGNAEAAQNPYPSLSAPSRLRRREALPSLAPETAVRYGYGEGESSPGEMQKDRFRKQLADMKLPRDQKDELAARIERRLILNESQLEGAQIRYEKLEARGLDYVGKQTIAKQAIASASCIEAVMPGEGSTEQRILGVPEALEKNAGETILVIRTSHNQGEKIRLPLGKISLLRRIKQSIFGE